MRILVTGGAGFIGSHIVDSYIQAGHTVTVLDDLSTGRKENINKAASFCHMDMRSPELIGLFRETRFDAVNHQAGRGNVRLSLDAPQEYAAVNIMGGLNLLQCAAATGVRKIIYANTGGCAFGELRYSPADEMHPIAPKEPYGASKASFELFLPFFAETHRLNYTVLRYPNIYGPRQHPDGEAGIASIFSGRLLRGLPIIVYGDGEQERDYVFVSDAVRANVMVLDAGDQNIYNLGWGRGVTVNEIVRRLQVIADTPLAVQHEPAKAGEVRRSMLDSSKIRAQLGWVPTVDLDEGLRRTFEFVRTQFTESRPPAVTPE